MSNKAMKVVQDNQEINTILMQMKKKVSPLLIPLESTFKNQTHILQHCMEEITSITKQVLVLLQENLHH